MQSLTEHKEIFLDQYPQLFDRVYRFMMSRVPHKEEAEDLTQQVFLNSFRRLSQFDPEKGSLEQWIISSARNAIIDHWRGRRELINLETIEDRLADLKQTSKDALDFELRIHKLPPTEQALLRLRYIDGLTYQDIARRTGNSPTAVRSTFSRLHRRLKTTWQTYE